MHSATFPPPLQRSLTEGLKLNRPATKFDDQQAFQDKVQKDGNTSAREVYKRNISTLGQDNAKATVSFSSGPKLLAPMSPQSSKTFLVSPQTSKESLSSQLSGRQTVVASSEQNDADWTFSELSRFEETHSGRLGIAPSNRYAPKTAEIVPRLDLQRVNDSVRGAPDAVGSRDSAVASHLSLEPASEPASSPAAHFFCSTSQAEVLVMRSPLGASPTSRPPTDRIIPFSARERPPGRHFAQSLPEMPLTARPPNGITPRGLAQLPPKTPKLTSSIDRFFKKEDRETRAAHNQAKLHETHSMDGSEKWGEHVWTGGKFKDERPFAPSWLVCASGPTRTRELRKEQSKIRPTVRGAMMMGEEVDRLPGFPVQVPDGTGKKVIPYFRFRDEVQAATFLHGPLLSAFPPSGGPDTEEWRRSVQRQASAAAIGRWTQPKRGSGTGASRVLPVGWNGDHRSTLVGSVKEGWSLRPVSPRTNGRSGTWLVTGKSSVERAAEVTAGGAYYLGEKRLPGWTKEAGRKGGGWREGPLAMVWEQEREQLAQGGWDHWDFQSLKSRVEKNHDFRGLDEGRQTLDRAWRIFLSMSGLEPLPKGVLLRTPRRASAEQEPQRASAEQEQAQVSPQARAE